MEEKKKSKRKPKTNCATSANVPCPILKDLLLPKDTNANFDIFGGVLMSRMDIAGALFARGISPLQKWVTVAVNNIVFKKPVQVGDVLSIYAQQKRMGTSSLTIALQGVVERKGEVFEAVSAEFVFVTVDANHKSEPIQVKTKSSECRSCAN